MVQQERKLYLVRINGVMEEVALAMAVKQGVRCKNT